MTTAARKTLQRVGSERTRRRRETSRKRYLSKKYGGLTPEAVALAIGLQQGLCSTPDCESGTELVVDLDGERNVYVMTCRTCMTKRHRPHLSPRPQRVLRVRAEAPSLP